MEAEKHNNTEQESSDPRLIATWVWVLIAIGVILSFIMFVVFAEPVNTQKHPLPNEGTVQCEFMLDKAHKG